MLEATRNRDPKVLQTLNSHGESRDQDPRKPGDISVNRAAAVTSFLRSAKLIDRKNTGSEISPNPSTDDLEIRALESKRFMDALEPSTYSLNKKEPSPQPLESENETAVLSQGWKILDRYTLSFVIISIAFFFMSLLSSATEAWACCTQDPSCACLPTCHIMAYNDSMVDGVVALYHVCDAVLTWDFLIGNLLPFLNSLAMLSLLVDPDVFSPLGMAYNTIANFKHTIIRHLSRYAKTAELTISNVLRMVGWSEPLLEDGKSRVRWKCVSLRIPTAVTEKH